MAWPLVQNDQKVVAALEHFKPTEAVSVQERAFSRLRSMPLGTTTKRTDGSLWIFCGWTQKNPSQAFFVQNVAERGFHSIGSVRRVVYLDKLLETFPDLARFV